MSELNHPVSEEELLAFLDCSASDEVRKKVELHLEDCLLCQIVQKRFDTASEGDQKAKTLPASGLEEQHEDVQIMNRVYRNIMKNVHILPAESVLVTAASVPHEHDGDPNPLAGVLEALAGQFEDWLRGMVPIGLGGHADARNYGLTRVGDASMETKRDGGTGHDLYDVKLGPGSIGGGRVAVEMYFEIHQNGETTETEAVEFEKVEAYGGVFYHAVLPVDPKCDLLRFRMRVREKDGSKEK